MSTLTSPTARLFRRNIALLAAQLLVLALMLSSCAIFRPTGRPSDPLAALRYDIDQILADSIFTPSRAAIKVIAADSKEVLYERDSKILIRPASNMKLLTSAAALHVLGKDHQFKTSAFADTTQRDSVLDGNLYLKGFGDPDLVTADLDTLVAQVRSTGVKHISGGVVADVSFFDNIFWGYGWKWDYEPASYAPFISPLAINDNCVKVSVTPGEAGGDSLHVVLDPPTSYLTVLNKGTTVADTVLHRASITRLFAERSNTIVVDGEMLPDADPIERRLSVWKPELYVSSLFTEALKQGGISVAKGPMLGLVPAGGREIATRHRRLDSAITTMNKESDNLTAEMLLKTCDAITNGVSGSTGGGIYLVKRFLSTLGIDTTTYALIDGSGLSYSNLVTVELLVQLLDGMQTQSDLFRIFYSSLPIAGVDGTLSNRMKKTPAEGNLRAKTGSIGGVITLSGYVQSADGERLIFSMSMQNFTSPARSYQRAQDRIGAILAGFSRFGTRPPLIQ